MEKERKEWWKRGVRRWRDGQREREGGSCDSNRKHTILVYGAEVQKKVPHLNILIPGLSHLVVVPRGKDADKRLLIRAPAVLSSLEELLGFTAGLSMIRQLLVVDLEHACALLGLRVNDLLNSTLQPLSGNLITTALFTKQQCQGYRHPTAALWESDNDRPVHKTPRSGIQTRHSSSLGIS